MRIIVNRLTKLPNKSTAYAALLPAFQRSNSVCMASQVSAFMLVILAIFAAICGLQEISSFKNFKSASSGMSSIQATSATVNPNGTIVSSKRIFPG